MTHAGTIKAQRREADRVRKAAERAARKAAKAPTPAQVDLAVCEAVSFVLASTSFTSGKMTDVTLPLSDVVGIAANILVKRWRLNKAECKKALKARLSPRPEHDNPSWYPHHKRCEPNFWSDISMSNPLSTPVTSSGQVPA